MSCVREAKPSSQLLIVIDSMAEAFNDTQREFWQSPTLVAPLVKSLPSGALPTNAACIDCGTEFLVGAKFCHSCGAGRPRPVPLEVNVTVVARVWARGAAEVKAVIASVAESWPDVRVPVWLRYLHFHQIQRAIGLPTGSLVAFLIGVGCVAGAIGVSFFYKASNLAEFDAIQMWRLQWLVAATASFVAGILLKKPSGSNRE